MPDEKFEQQARDMADGFRIEPQPAVWQRVQNAISTSKRKRRFVFWWLLPLCIIGGSVIGYLTFKAKNGKEQMTLTTANIKFRANDSSNLNNGRKKINNQKASVKGDAKAGEITVTVYKHKKYNKDTFSSRDTIKNATVINGKKAINSRSLIGSQPQAIRADSSIYQYEDKKVVQADNDSAALTGARQNLAGEITASTVIDNVVDSTKKDSSAVLSQILPNTVISHLKKHNNWQWGVVVERGITSKNSSLLSLLSFNSLEKSLNSSFDGNIVTLPGTSSYRTNEQVKHGAAFGLGFALQKHLTRKIDFIADVTYQYQSLKTSAIIYRDSIAPNSSSFTTAVNNYKSTQQFHFATVFAGVNWNFINKKYIRIGVNGGIDNFLLLATGQHIYNSTYIYPSAGSYYFNRDSLTSVTMLSKSRFYTYQPHLLAGIVTTVQFNNNSQLQLIPFMRSSLVNFEKNTSSGNNHLFSAGLRVIYFFK